MPAGKNPIRQTTFHVARSVFSKASLNLTKPTIASGSNFKSVSPKTNVSNNRSSTELTRNIFSQMSKIKRIKAVYF